MPTTIYCGLCVEACPCDAIRMDTQKIENAGYTRQFFIADKDYLIESHPADESPFSIALY